MDFEELLPLVAFLILAQNVKGEAGQRLIGLLREFLSALPHPYTTSKIRIAALSDASRKSDGNGLMKLHYATTNIGKVKSLQRSFKPHGVDVIQTPLDLPEPRSSDVQEIAREKVIYAYAHVGQPIVVLDAGFYIFSLRGFPRAYVNFALETIGLEGMLRLVAGKDRACEFQECLAYLDETLAEPKYFIGHFRGSLADQPRGRMQSHLWSELALIFIPEGRTKTLAEMAYEEYMGWYTQVSERSAPDKQFAD